MAKGDRIVLSQNLYTVGKSDIAAMPARVEREIQDALYQLGRETRDMARSYCPRQTGTLEASIYVTRGGRGDEQASVNSPFTRQSTQGYFKAINAAIRKGTSVNRSQLLQRAVTNNKLSLGGSDLVETSTQRPIPGATRTHTVAGEEFEFSKKGTGSHAWAAKDYQTQQSFKRGSSSIGGLNFRSYSSGVGSANGMDIDYITPTTMEMGAAGRQSFFVTVGAAAHYAGDVEFGHALYLHGNLVGHVEARPFMRPALAWAKTQLSARVTAAFKRGLAR